MTFTAEQIAGLRGLDAHRAAREDLALALQEIDADSGGGTLSAEQMATFEATTKQIGELDTAIEQLELRKKAIETFTRTGIAGATELPFAAPNVVKKPENLYDLASYRQRANSVDELPALYRDGAMRVIEKADYPTADSSAKAQAYVARLVAEHPESNGLVARRIITTDSPAYREAYAEYVTVGRERMDARRLAVLQSGVDADGGFQLPFTIDPTFILTTSGAASALRDISRIETITTKSWHPITTEGVTASYGTETAAATDQAPSDLDDLNGVTPIRAKTFIKFTAEYQEDYGPAAVIAALGGLIRDAKDLLEAEKFVQGTGSGEPEGIIWKLDDDGTSLVERADFDLPSLDALTAALGPRFRAGGKASYMSNLAILLGTRGMGTAGAPANSIYDQVTGTLNGYPAVESSFMDDVWTAGKEVLLFGDFKQFVIVDRIGLSTEFVPQVFDGSGDPLGQRGIYARWRNMSKVITVNGFRLLTCNGS